MTTRVDFKAKNGETTHGDLALPDAPKAPAVVVIQEWWGVNDHIRSIASRLAAEGFLAFAPDLYDGEVVSLDNEPRAAERMNTLDWPRAVSQLEGAVEFVRAHPRSTGKVSVLGFCMGGALTLATATRAPNLAAAVAFYGVPPEADYAKVTAPVLMHVASRDQWVTVEKGEAVKRALESHGKSVALHVYEAEHAFFNDTRPKVHSKEASQLAWQRTIAFLKEHSS